MKKRRPEDIRKAEANPIKAYIEELMKAYSIDDKFDDARLVAFWPKIMGQAIQNHTTKIYAYNKTLFVYLDSAALRQELHMSKRKILELYQKEFGTEILKEVILR